MSYQKLHGLESKEEILEMLAQRARKLPKGEWVSVWGIENLSLSYDYYSTPTDDIRNVKAVMTFVGGKIVFDRQKTPNVSGAG
jgi:predicted amidohydrolase YtcJ